MVIRNLVVVLCIPRSCQGHLKVKYTCPLLAILAQVDTATHHQHDQIYHKHCYALHVALLSIMCLSTTTMSPLNPKCQQHCFVKGTQY
jgi:hypothetical protein